MANIFANGDELLNKKDFDKKVDVDQPLFKVVNTPTNNYLDMFNNPLENILQVIRFDTTSTDLVNGNVTSAIVFGGRNTRAMIEIHWSEHYARISGFHTDTHDSWHEDIAWKSDIANLQGQVNDLRNQIKLLTKNQNGSN